MITRIYRYSLGSSVFGWVLMCEYIFAEIRPSGSRFFFFLKDPAPPDSSPLPHPPPLPLPPPPPPASPPPPPPPFRIFFKRSCKFFAPATNFDDLHNAS